MSTYTSTSTSNDTNITNINGTLSPAFALALGPHSSQTIDPEFEAYFGTSGEDVAFPAWDAGHANWAAALVLGTQPLDMTLSQDAATDHYPRTGDPGSATQANIEPPIEFPLFPTKALYDDSVWESLWPNAPVNIPAPPLVADPYTVASMGEYSPTTS